MRRLIGFALLAVAGASVLLSAPFVSAEAGGGAPNFVPELTLSFIDPESGDRLECGRECRRFEVPAGVELEIRVEVRRIGGQPTGDEPTWDLWFNQPGHPFPGFDLTPCWDEEGRLDAECWQALADRVDRATWDGLTPDVVCVPGTGRGSCEEATLHVTMDPDFEGERRRGVYHFSLWVNRFSTLPEADEFDNFAGPIRVTVEGGRVDPVEVPVESGAPADASADRVPGPPNASESSPLIIGPSSAMPYGVVVVPEEVETSFSLSSKRSQGILEFSPACTGRIHVEVTQTGAYENMSVEVREVPSGEVLIQARGKGRLRLDGGIDAHQLKGDRTFEVVVVPGQGTRGVRGSIRVSYPARLKFMVNP